MTEPQIPPHSIEAEQCILGAILMNNEAFGPVSGIIDAAHFYEPAHQQIFDTCAKLIGAGRLANPLTLRTFLPADVTILGMSLGVYLARLCAEGTTIINAPDYARTIRDLADLRTVMSIGRGLADSSAVTPDDAAAEAVEALDTILSARTLSASPVVSMRQAMARAVDATAKAYQAEGRMTGITWGLRDLDHKTLGLQRSESAILAGRPGMGKTALAICIARSAGESGERGLFASLEMDDVSLMQRAMSDVCYDKRPVSYHAMRAGRLTELQFNDMVAAGEHLAKLPVVIDQRPGLTVAQIASRARQMKRRDGLDFLIVDHIHLVRASDRYAGRRVEEVGEISAGLKALAKELDIAVVGLCQLSRQVEQRDDKRPTMADLRWSGEIEQDADLIVMLYREQYYLQNREPKPGSEEYMTWERAMEAAHNKLEIGIEKARNGPTGRVTLHCSIENNAIRDMAPDAVHHSRRAA